MAHPAFTSAPLLFSSALVLSIGAVIGGCGSTENDGGAGGAGAATTGSVVASTSGNGSTVATTSTTVATASASITVGALMSCDAAGLTACFSSYECAMEERCQDQGTIDAPVPCCTPGPRGTGLAGDPCGGEGDCLSSLCFELGAGGESYCTDACTDAAADCPMPFTSCGPIMMSGSDLMWCLP